MYLETKDNIENWNKGSEKEVGKLMDISNWSRLNIVFDGLFFRHFLQKNNSRP